MSGPTTWPRAAVVAGLAAGAAVLAALELARPDWTPRLGPAVLSAATLVVGALVRRHSRALHVDAGAPWRLFSGIAGLLALGQFVRSLTQVVTLIDRVQIHPNPLPAHG